MTGNWQIRVGDIGWGWIESLREEKRSGLRRKRMTVMQLGEIIARLGRRVASGPSTWKVGSGLPACSWLMAINKGLCRA